MMHSKRRQSRKPRRSKRLEGYYYVPHTNIVLVVQDAKIVTIKRLEWLR